jgi:hypothetical protein
LVKASFSHTQKLCLFKVKYFYRNLKNILLFLPIKNIDYPILTRLTFLVNNMAIATQYEMDSSDDLNFNGDDDYLELDNNIADFELSTGSNEVKNSRQNHKRNFLAKKKIEQLQEAKRLRKLEEDYFDDWD